MLNERRLNRLNRRSKPIRANPKRSPVPAPNSNKPSGTPLPATTGSIAPQVQLPPGTPQIQGQAAQTTGQAQRKPRYNNSSLNVQQDLSTPASYYGATLSSSGQHHSSADRQQQQGYANHSTAWSSRRPRASTIGNMDAIPLPIQRATALMNPAQPIRAQPSPSYIPPPELQADGQRRPSQAKYGEVVRNLEEGLPMYWS